MEELDSSWEYVVCGEYLWQTNLRRMELFDNILNDVHNSVSIDCSPFRQDVAPSPGAVFPTQG